MKKIFQFIMPCLGVAVMLTSCYDTMDDKAEIDAKYQGAYSNPTVAISSATSSDYSSIEVVATVDDATIVYEQGVEFASDEDFTDVKVVKNDTVEAQYTAVLSDLEELTTKFVRAYAMGKNGVIVYSDVQSVTSQAAPVIPIDGVYTVVEWAGDSQTGNWDLDEETDPYKVTFAFEEGSTEIVNITNIWDSEATVQGLYDAETNTVTVPNYQVIFVHPSYGDVWLRGLAMDFSGYTDGIVFNFNPKGGAMKSTPMAAQCAAGNFAFFYLVMQHD